MAGKRIIEFEVTRRPEIRVLCRDFRRSTVQWLGEEVQLHLTGTAHMLWASSRVFSATTSDEFAEHSVELLMSQGLRLSSIEARDERLTAELARVKRHLEDERAIREVLEHDANAREGVERTARRILAVVQRPKRAGLSDGRDR